MLIFDGSFIALKICSSCFSKRSLVQNVSVYWLSEFHKPLPTKFVNNLNFASK